MATECFYKILNISDTATPEEIKKSYRSLSMKWHPDKNPDNQEEAKTKFQKINEAYETLSDPEKKHLYDLQKNNPLFNMKSTFHNSDGININDLNNIFANMFNPFPNFSSGGMNMNMGGMPNIRIFTNGNMFGQNKPQLINYTLTVSLEQVLVGTTIPIEIERYIIDGNTKTTEKETLYISIPKGIDDGEIIILQEKGNIIHTNNNPSTNVLKGDIKIFIKVENKTEFKRVGLDLIFYKKITLKEALCGFSFELKHINGKLYTINNNNGNIITPNYKKIIPNMGLLRDNHIGNLIIQFEVIFPEKLNETVIKELAKLL